MATALLVGATGLIGAELLGMLARDPAYSSVMVLVRRPMPAGGTVVTRVVDFGRLEEHADAMAVDHVFCALGTTMRVAGSRKAFFTVDHDYPLAVARLTRAAGARHFALVSALGADVGSRVFYNRVKGETERDIAALHWPSLTIVRPSLLLGPRRDRRPGEEIAKWFGPLVPRRWKPIQGSRVAAAMVRAAREERAGVRAIESGEMQ